MSPTISLSNADFTAKLNHINPGEVGEAAVLFWHDGVANSTREVYPDMSTALLRLALLVFSSDMEGEAWFAQTDAESFQPVANLMRRLAIQYPYQSAMSPEARTEIVSKVIGMLDALDEGRARAGDPPADPKQYARAVRMLLEGTYNLNEDEPARSVAAADAGEKMANTLTLVQAALQRFQDDFDIEALEPLNNFAVALEFHGRIKSLMEWDKSDAN